MIPGMLVVALALGELAFRREPRVYRLAWSLGGFGILAGGLGLWSLTFDPAPFVLALATAVSSATAIVLGWLLMRDRAAGVTWLWVPVLAVMGGTMLGAALNLAVGVVVVRYLSLQRAALR